MDSSAATTSISKSIPPAPASMLRTNRSCPGTSTKPRRTPSTFEKREPQIDGDPAALFLFQSVGMGAGQRLDERGLPVVDVSGGTDDDVFGFHRAIGSPMLAEQERRGQIGRGQRSQAWAAVAETAEAISSAMLKRGLARIRRTCDGAADDQIIGPGLNGFGRSGDAGLVVCGGVCGSHARNNNQELRPAGCADRSYFVRRGDHSVKSRLLRKPGKSQGAGSRANPECRLRQGQPRPCWSES